MTDEIIEELWRIKDNIARDHGYNLDTLVAYLRSKERSGDHPVIDSMEKGVGHDIVAERSWQIEERNRV